MNNKLNTEEIMQLIPDYITGDISDADKALVEKAIGESPEIAELYRDMKGALEFAGAVKQAEPAPQYWNSLLPRIHERLEAEQNKGFSWEKLSAVWKVLVPVAAVILIALVYYIVKPSNTQLTEDKNTEQKIEQKNIEQKKNDSAEKQEIKQHDNTADKQNIKDEEKNLNKLQDKKEKIRNYDVKKNESVAKDETPMQKNETPEKVEVKEELLADDIDIDETAVFAAGEAGGLDEETVSEINKLSSTEQNSLLDELLKSNL